MGMYPRVVHSSFLFGYIHWQFAAGKRCFVGLRQGLCRYTVIQYTAINSVSFCRGAL